MAERKPGRPKRAQWNAQMVRDLRQAEGLTQQELADRLGVRQQTISEWETGMYQPRGASATLLTRIAEDALRILRFFRFLAWYGRGEPDAAALAACERMKDRIGQLSAERISKELLKLLGAEDRKSTRLNSSHT